MLLDWYGKGLFPSLSCTTPPPVTSRSKYPSDLVSVNPSLRARPLETLTPLNPCPEGVRTLPLTMEAFLKYYCYEFQKLKIKLYSFETFKR